MRRKLERSIDKPLLGQAKPVDPKTCTGKSQSHVGSSRSGKVLGWWWKLRRPIQQNKERKSLGARYLTTRLPKHRLRNTCCAFKKTMMLVWQDIGYTIPKVHLPKGDFLQRYRLRSLVADHRLPIVAGFPFDPDIMLEVHKCTQCRFVLHVNVQVGRRGCLKADKRKNHP